MTGSSSSYARKYALNGLFLLDDAKDPDSDERKDEEKTSQKQTSGNNEEKATPKQIELLKKVYKDENYLNLLFNNNISKIEDLPRAKATSLIKQIIDKENKKNA